MRHRARAAATRPGPSRSIEPRCRDVLDHLRDAETDDAVTDEGATAARLGIGVNLPPPSSQRRPSTRCRTGWGSTSTRSAKASSPSSNFGAVSELLDASHRPIGQPFCIVLVYADSQRERIHPAGAIDDRCVLGEQLHPGARAARGGPVWSFHLRTAATRGQLLADRSVPAREAASFVTGRCADPGARAGTGMPPRAPVEHPHLRPEGGLPRGRTPPAPDLSNRRWFSIPAGRRHCAW